MCNFWGTSFFFGWGLAPYEKCTFSSEKYCRSNGSDRFSSEEKVKTMTARDPMKALPKARLVSIKLCMHEFSIVLTDMLYIMYTLYISLFSI